MKMSAWDVYALMFSILGIKVLIGQQRKKIACKRMGLIQEKKKKKMMMKKKSEKLLGGY